MAWKGNSSLNSDYYVDPVELAKGVIANEKTSLIPSSSASVDLPSMPTYTAPNKETFDWNVPVSERPAGTENWIWSRSRWAKENFDNEQKSKSDEAYRKYQIDLQNWQNTLSLINAQKEAEQQKLENYNAQQTALGLVPSTSLNDPSAQIRQLGKAYMATTDPTLQNQLHQKALDLAVNAGWLQPGQVAESVSLLPQMTAAGTPDYATTYKERAYKDALAQQQLENQLAQDKYDLSASKGTRGSNPVDSPSDHELNPYDKRDNDIQGYVERNKGKFATPHDFYWQVMDNVKAGKVEAAYGKAILKYLAGVYGSNINTQERGKNPFKKTSTKK